MTMSDRIFGYGVLALVLLGLYGYAANVYELATAVSIDGMALLRVIGVIFPPLGAIIGFL